MDWHLNHHRTSITYAIILFLMFDGIALGLNVWLTKRVQSHTIELNLAGRQRMLSQKLAKEFLLAPPGSTNKERLDELNQTANLFDRTLSAFRKGGTTIDTNNQLVTLKDMKDRPYYYLIEESWSIWQPIREQVFTYTRTPSVKIFLGLNEELTEKNLALLSYMNSLALEIEEQARHETRQIRVLQSTALCLGIIVFFIGFWLYRRRTQLLEREQSLIDTLINNMPSAMVFSDAHGNLLHANVKFTELLGISLDEAKRYKISEIIEPHPTHEHLFTLTHKAFCRAVLKVERSSAIEYGRHLSIWRIEDISDAYYEQEQLSNIAYKDPLTGLDNRVAFEKHLNLINENLKSSINAVMFIDLNGFKKVNDVFGHSKGDEILMEVGERLLTYCNESCCVARYGGDEFTVLSTGLHDQSDAEIIAQNILTDLDRPFKGLNSEISIGASIGIVTFSAPQQDITDIIRHADSAMYLAKQSDQEMVKIHINEIGRTSQSH